MGALVSGAVLLPAAPALADVNTSPNAMELNPGDNRDITITVSGGDADNPQATITVPNELSGEITLKGPNGCQGSGTGVLDCGQQAFEGNQLLKRLTVTVTAKNPSGLQPGQTRQANIAVEVGNENDNVGVRVKGPQQAASVTEVSGKVVNQATGEGVANAQVSLKDSANNEHNATANGKGEFRITPQGGKPIVAGQLTLTAAFEGFAEGTKTANGVAGKATNGVEIRMKPTAASAPPSAPAAAETTPTEEASPGVSGIANPSNTSGDSDGPSLLSWLLIGMGVLLVLLGVGAIVLLMMRRKDDGDDSDDYAQGAPNPMAPVGAAAGGYRGNDRTMVAGSPGMNDATAIVGPQQPLDEFPDPYAAPAPTRVGYGGGAYNGTDQATNVTPSPGYGRGGGYGDEPGYGRGEPGYNNGGYRDDRGGYEPQRGGYDDQRGGYGGGGGGGGGYGEAPRPRYDDQPTGHYQAGGGGGYPTSGGFGGAGAPGGPANGYGPSGGVPGPGGGAPANGYGPGGAHGAPANGYGVGQGGGYDDGGRGDFGRGGGYPSAGGYERQPSEYDRGGDPRNGGRGGGRSVDWLD